MKPMLWPLAAPGLDGNERELSQSKTRRNMYFKTAAAATLSLVDSLCKGERERGGERKKRSGVICHPSSIILSCVHISDQSEVRGQRVTGLLEVS